MSTHRGRVRKSSGIWWVECSGTLTCCWRSVDGTLAAACDQIREHIRNEHQETP
ncbi:hypothetical protein CLV28_0696 [Sediminihabitans luteus]|uniref:DUF1059 domain-containing protein n=1 Tax=Sediminihabitans luteus TaxID=1138585 RepID=A0A2M9D011_9CELL|nr:hypothetical protein [Sediminihabitans luteus]PJJ77477.1 hypothetical protein CLV28_0696 [Sediminihabitans luteus]GII98373.1 hypothetical protein Slu03_07510 [Sediminihabitans luteus]